MIATRSSIRIRPGTLFQVIKRKTTLLVQWSHHSASISRPEFTLYDSLSDTYKIIPNESSKGIAWYTCGPTTYAPAHLGHARTYVCLDILRRVLEHHLKAVTSNQQAAPPLFVMNITDVDDKILAAARDSGQAPLDLARRYEEDFWKDLDALNCLRPHLVTRVSEHVDSDIVPYIQKLCTSGMAYELEDGVYFDVRGYENILGKVTKYGKLAPSSSATDFFNLDENHPTEADAGHKRDPRDFVLWKKRKESEDLFWDSPWGAGRPGWHIECSAMIEAVANTFSETHDFVFHAGGVDLKFPHHTNEIAQSEAYHGASLKDASKEWIPHWVHTGHLHIDGHKMSKSLKNFITIEELLQEKQESSLTSAADDFRLWCLGLGGSYRGSATYSRGRIDEARATREKIVKFLLDASEWVTVPRNSSTKKWSETDHRLFNDFNLGVEASRKAIISDLDGKSFLREIVLLAEMGGSYLRSYPFAPVEPMVHCVQSLRETLALVGFSPKTVSAGAIQQGSGKNSEGIAGGERALIEELVQFRFKVRNAALLEIQEGGAPSNAVSEILELCDQARDTVLPSIGLELVDGDEHKAWGYCFPRDPTSGCKDAPSVESISLVDIPLEDFFKVGQYRGMFAEYTEDGIPLTNADGTDISKRQMKKLMKKRGKHACLLKGE